MKSFHGKVAIKNKYLKRIRAHYKADELIKGKYWENGKGCAVGCTIHGSDHKLYETELGLPEWLARVEDTIFEGLPNERAKTWPIEFLKAIKVGSNLNKIKTKFIVFILENSIISIEQVKYDKATFPEIEKVLNQSKSAIKEVIRCHKEELDLSAAWSAAESAAESAARSAARSAAWSAASAAESAARSAAESAAWSAAWSAARSAAESAAWSAASAAESAAESAARSAARSAASAAESAARSAAESAAWSAARSAARSAAYVKYADRLLELLREAR